MPQPSASHGTVRTGSRRSWFLVPRTNNQAPGTLVRATLLVLCSCFVVPSGQELLDRLVAIVGTRGITLSDVRAAVELGLVPRARDEAQVVHTLVDRALMLQEVSRYGAGAPAEEEVARRLAALETRVGPEALAQVMARVGLDPARLEAIVREEIELERYLADRFGAAAQPTEDEVRQYYDEHQEAFTRDGVRLPFAEVEDEARATLAARRRDRLLESWKEDLRRRGDVRILWPEEAKP